MKASDLVNTVSMILMQQERKRTQGEEKDQSFVLKKKQNYISNAKIDADAEKYI